MAFYTLCSFLIGLFRLYLNLRFLILLNFKVLNLLIYVRSIMICLGEICIIVV